MANNLTFEQSAAVLNSLAAQVTGRTDLVAVDYKTFVSVAQTALLTGVDPIAQGISQVLDRTLFAVRPYYAKFTAMMKTDAEFGAWDRKINFCDDEFVADAGYPLTDGQSVDQYVVRKPKTLQLNFYGQNIVQDYITRSEEQLKVAFRGPAEFGEFFAGALQNLSDKHEQKTENIARMNLANAILGVVGANKPKQRIRLLTEYNAATGQELTDVTVMLPANYPSFMRWAFARIQIARDMLAQRSVIYHLNVTGKEVARHTPYDKQVLYIYAPEMRQMEAQVLSTTYHDNRVEFKSVELVPYWQSINTPMSVKGKPVYMGADGALVNATADATVGNVLAVLCDDEAMGVRRYSEGMRATPLNARGRYTNLWYNWRWRNYVDFTENILVFTLD